MSRGPNYNVIDGDWRNLSIIISDLSSRIIDEDTSFSDYLLADGSRALTANWDAGSYQIRAETFQSDITTGTAPFTVASTTAVTNLNADLLDGQHGAYYAASATGVTSSANLVDNSIIRGDGGALGVQDSGILIDDSDNVTGMGTLSCGAITSSALTSGRILIASTSGLIADDADLTFSVDTLTVTKIAAFELTGKLTAGANEIEGSAFDINGGTVDGITSLTVANDVNIGNYQLTCGKLVVDSTTIDGTTVTTGTLDSTALYTNNIYYNGTDTHQIDFTLGICKFVQNSFKLATAGGLEIEFLGNASNQLEIDSSTCIVSTCISGTGMITDTSGSISFDNENLSTTGTLGCGVLTAASGSSIGNLTLANGSITDSGGTISTGDDHIKTTGGIGIQSGSTTLGTNRGVLVGGDSGTKINVPASNGYRGLSSEVFGTSTANNARLYGYYSAIAPTGDTYTYDHVAGMYGYIALIEGVAGWLNVAVTDVIGCWSDVYVAAGTPNVTNGYGYKCERVQAGATRYGLYLPTISGGATANWAIYSAGGDSVFGGNLRVGGTTAPTNALSLDLDDKIDFGDNAVSIWSDDDGYLDLTADVGIRLNGNTGINTTPATSASLNVGPISLTTTGGYDVIAFSTSKEGGITDVGDTMVGLNGGFTMNQTGGVIGNMYGLYFFGWLADGDIGTAVDSRSLWGIISEIELDAGTNVYGSAYGHQSKVNQDGGTITGDIYGHHVWVDSDGTVNGSVYMLYLDEYTGIDYGIYQSGTAENVLGGKLTFPNSADSGAIADEVSLGAYEIGAGQRALAISQEYDAVAEVDETKFSHKLPVRINGSTYYVMLTVS